MKWAVILLTLLGLVAAVCAAVLVAAIRSGSGVTGTAKNNADPEIEILVAARELPAVMVIDGDCVAKKTIQRSLAPKGYLTEAVQVVGQVLAVQLLEGQPFTLACFVTDGSGKTLAAALRHGMRAVSISLSDYSGMDGILYPGSVVDVIVSYQLPNSQGEDNEMVSRTLLQGVQVLAIESQTIGSEQDVKSLPTVLKGSQRRMITLMLTERQAEMLQLAMAHGTVSLSMRNPLDTAQTRSDGVLLSELSPDYYGRLTQTGYPETSFPTTAPAATPDMPAPRPGPRPAWEMVILRGTTRETRSVSMPTEQPASGGAGGAG